MRTIVTRPAAQAQAWIEALRSRGIDAAALPLIGIAPAADAAPVHAAWRELQRHALVVFVSPNAAEQFFAVAPANAAWPTGTQAASPGPGTTLQLRALGVPAKAIVEPRDDAAQFDSEALWEQLRGADWRGRSALIVRGDGGRDWLVNTLREAGAEVTVVAAYRRTLPTLDAAQRALLDAAMASPARHLWLLSSSEAIDNLETLCANRAGHDCPTHDWPAARAIATHPRIAQRARALGFGQVHDARPGLDAVVACIQSIGP